MVHYLRENDIDDDIRLLLSIQNNIYLDEDKIPPHLINLLATAQKWGTLRSSLIYRIMEKVETEVLQDYIKTVEPYVRRIQDWLTDEAIEVNDINNEYLAFTNLIHGFERAKIIIKSRS